MSSMLAQETVEAQISIVAEGLLNPVGMARLPDGSLFIAEEGTGEGDLSAGVSLLLPDGSLGRYISGFPSNRDSGDLSGVPLVALSPDNRILYVGNFNARHLWTLSLPENLTIPDVPYTLADMGRAMEPLNNVFVTNPFDMTFDSEGVPVVSDASQNGVAKELPDGTTRFIHRFTRIPNPENERITIDPVPTGIVRIGQEYYVTLTGGCPFPRDGGQLVAIDENRNERMILSGLNMPIDVAQGTDGTIWLLEFATFTPHASCFTGEGYEANTGRLSRLLEDGTLYPVVTDLNFPGAVVPMPDGSLYVSEVFAGHILHIRFESGSRAADSSGLFFSNVAAEVGLDFRHGAFNVRPSWDPVAGMGGGLCWLDYDRNGWLDLYLVNSHALTEKSYWEERDGLPRNALYHNDGGTFRNVSQVAKADLVMRGNGCVAADFNRDGWTDIFITASGSNALLWNEGDGTFSEGAALAGLAESGWNSAAVVGDLNADGWPDLFVGTYIDLEDRIFFPTGAFPQDYYGQPDHLYINEGLDATGKATFREVSVAVGLVREERTLGAILSDLDNDGDLDLYIANDGQPNRLYQNEPLYNDPEGIGFRFIDLTDTASVGDSGSGMGVASGDYDGDGQFDLFVTNWDTELNALYRNETIEQGHLNFRYSTFRIGMRGLGNNMTGWGATWADFDHDTDEDLLVVNGHVPVTNLDSNAELVRFYGNRSMEGHPAQYIEWTDQVGLDRVGPLMARGSAAADFDNDGDLDIAINCIGGQVVLLRNERSSGNWLIIDFAGVVPGVIASLHLPDGRILRRETHAGSSYLASEDPRLHFGLGDIATIPEVVVRWTDGRVEQQNGVEVNQHLVFNDQ